jgi:DNA transposase THAP9
LEVTLPVTPKSSARRALFLDHQYEKSPTTLRKKFKNSIDSQKKKKPNLKRIIQKTKRQSLKIKKNKIMLRDLRIKCGLHQKTTTYLENAFPSAISEVLKRFKKGGKRKFTPEMRAFALTLNFYSPKAYNYIRQTFNNSLPHPSTLRSWYHEVKVTEGFTEESFKTLNTKSVEYKAKGKPLYCSLMLDEMHIKKQIEWDGKYCHGFSSIGKNSNSSELAMKAATQVLVLLVVALDSQWKVPVGYFFHRGLNATETANIIQETLARLYTIGK